MIYKPHDYQKKAEEFLIGHPVAALFLQMGLGKTVVTLTALERLMFDYFEAGKVLIIAPLRVARDTWKEEVEKWDHLKNLKLSVMVGTEKERRAALNRKANIYIINRENVEWLVNAMGPAFDFDTVVIDELSSFKSYSSKRFRALMKVRPKVRRIIGLTGTPASNGLMDLFAEFNVLDMGERLGRFIGCYREEYFTPDKRNQNVIFSYKLKPGAEERIYEKISDITISMKALDYLKMPEKVENTITVHMNDEEAKKYKELKDELVVELQGEEVTALTAGSLAAKLMQAASGVVYKEGGSFVAFHERKLDALEERIEALNGQGALVAYWFRFDKERIEKLLKKMKVSYSFLDTSSGIKAWKDKKVQVGLIHPASAGHGLNIQSGGSTLIWYTVPWSLELYEQTVARLWRQGQKDETVVIEHLVTAGTIDERILKAIGKKEITQSSLMDAVKADLGVKEGRNE